MTHFRVKGRYLGAKNQKLQNLTINIDKYFQLLYN